MSVSSWCSENGICKSTYYFWQKKVFTKLRNESQPQFAEVCVAAPAKITATVHLGNISVDIQLNTPCADEHADRVGCA